MSPHAAESLRAILTVIMGDGPNGKVYLAEDAPPMLIANIHRALELSAPTVEPWSDSAAKDPPTRRELHIVCDSLPGPESCIFIEAEDAAGRSVNCGTWRTRADGLAELVITELPIATTPDTATRTASGEGEG